MIFRLTILFLNIFTIIFISYYKFKELGYLKLYRYDDIIHFIMFFTIVLTSYFTLINFKTNLFLSKLAKLILLFFILLLPIISEFIQYYAPRRSPDISDLFYDYCGLVAGLIVILLYKYVKKINN